MNTTTPHPTGSRLQGLVEDLLGPVRAPRGTLQRRLLVARSVLAYGGIVLTLIQIVVWLMIGVISGRLDTPWWLWTTVPAAVGIVCLTVADRWRDWWNDVARTSHS
jgi:hypothetical protein